MIAQPVKALAKGITGMIRIGFGPEESEDLVSAPKPPREGHREVHEKREPLGLNEERSHGSFAPASELKLTEEPKRERALCNRVWGEAAGTPAVLGHASGAPLCATNA